MVQDDEGISSPLGISFLPKCLLCFYFLISKIINTSYGTPSLCHEASEAPKLAHSVAAAPEERSPSGC